MSNEFEEREKQGLGELVEDILEERGELFKPENGFSPPSQTPIGTPRPSGIPQDIETETRVLRKTSQAQAKSPKIPINVTSTWDSRLVNSRDWSIGDLKAFKAAANAESNDPIQEINLAFTVPAGYVGVLRSFSFQILNPAMDVFTLPAGGAPHGNIGVSILVDNIVQPNHDLLELGQEVDFYPTFILASETKTITLRVNYTRFLQLGFSSLILRDTYGAEANVPTLLHMYGQLLLARGLPTEFEIISQNITGR